ncbi:MAG: DNA/RNA helicase domain-containing protein [Enhygromyxa sp.]
MARYLYCAPLTDFLVAVETHTLVPELTQRMLELGDRPPSDAEVESWTASLPALAEVLADPIFATAEIFVELFMPLNGRRCDALLTGHNLEGPAAVVVELKQWSFVLPSHLSEHVFVGGRNLLHPAVQVRDYVETLRHFHSAFTDSAAANEAIELWGVAFLHGLEPRGDKAELRDPARYGELIHDFPLFYARERRLFARWLAERLVPGPGKAVAERIRSGRPKPSPKLLDLVVECIKGQHDWRLLDEQKTAYFAIRHAIQTAKDSHEKRVFVVRGGPGTGKSVLAIQLLADAARQRWAVAHATGSKAFQTVLQGRTQDFALDLFKRIHGVRTKKALPVGDLFTTFAEVAKLGSREPDRLDLAICDEAHRLWEFRRKKYPNGKVEWLSETSMIDEVIAASRVTVFFLDDNQSVRAGEIGRSSLILARAKALGVPYEVHELDAQFRCAGSTSYIHWVDGLLDFRAGLDLEWQTDRIYTARIWDQMPALDAHLRRQAELGRRCRLLAGYCWRWSKIDGLGRQPHDLVDPRFGGWSGAWIHKTGKDRKPLDHQYYKWASDDDAYEQVGSIYSVQGFEFDDIGVIWGEDLVWRRDRWIAQLERNKDNAFKRELRSSGGDAVGKLRNVYRVLLTRGMQSTHLFILDEETREHVRACLSARPERALVAVGAPSPRPTAPRLRVLSGRRFTPFEIDPVGPSPWTSGVPILDFHAAAGGFSPSWRDLVDPAHSDSWISWDDAPPFFPGDFVAQVRGDSMSPMIADGDWCLFKPAPIEQAIGRPSLVRLADDGFDGGRFTVKIIELEWAPGPGGELVRSALILRSHNPRYPSLRFEAGEQHEVTVLAVVRQVLGQRA